MRPSHTQRLDGGTEQAVECSYITVLDESVEQVSESGILESVVPLFSLRYKTLRNGGPMTECDQQRALCF